MAFRREGARTARRPTNFRPLSKQRMSSCKPASCGATAISRRRKCPDAMRPHQKIKFSSSSPDQTAEFQNHPILRLCGSQASANVARRFHRSASNSVPPRSSRHRMRIQQRHPPPSVGQQHTSTRAHPPSSDRAADHGCGCCVRNHQHREIHKRNPAQRRFRKYRATIARRSDRPRGRRIR